MVVPGCEIPVADRPVRAVAVAGVRFEVQVAPAVALASPQQGPSADDTGSDPQEVLAAVADRVRVVDVVDEELPRPLVAGGGVSRPFSVSSFAAQPPVIPEPMTIASQVLRSMI